MKVSKQISLFLISVVFSFSGLAAEKRGVDIVVELEDGSTKTVTFPESRIKTAADLVRTFYQTIGVELMIGKVTGTHESYSEERVRVMGPPVVGDSDTDFGTSNAAALYVSEESRLPFALRYGGST